MKNTPILSLELKRFEKCFKNEEPRVVLCYGRLSKLLPKVRGAKSITLNFYDKEVRNGVRIFARLPYKFINWGRRESCGEYIEGGEEVFAKFLTPGTKPFWLTATNVKK